VASSKEGAVQVDRPIATSDFYRALFGALDTGIAVFEILYDAAGRAFDYRFVLTNPAFERHTGLADAVGRTAKELVPGIEEKWVERYARIAATGRPEHIVDDAPSMEGRWFEVDAFPLGAAGGTLVGIHFQDVSERRRLEASVERHAAQLRTLLDQSPLGIWVVDDELRFVEVNPRAAVTLQGGDPLGRPLGDVMRSVWPSEVADAVVALCRRTLESGESFHDPSFADVRVDRGSAEHYDWRLDRIALPGGGYGVVCYFRETTAEVRAQEAVTASELRYRTLFDTIDDAFCVLEVILDDEGRCVDLRYLEANRAFERHTGLSDVVGRRAKELLPDLEPAWFEIYGHVARTGEPRRFSEPVAPLGRWYDLYAFRLGAPDEHKIAVLFSDVSDRVRTQDALRRSEEKYRSLFESIDSGFMIIQLLLDDEGEPSDWLIHEGNPAQERLTGLRGIAGATISSLVPGMEASWFENYASVALTGAPRRFVDHAEILGRSFDVYAFRIGEADERTVALLFSDITDRLRAEASLQESEARHAYLVGLSDALRDIADPVEIQSVACRLLGEHLDVARAMYFEVRGDSFVMERDHARGVPSMTGRYPIEVIGPSRMAAYSAGRSVRLDDLEAHADMSEPDRQVFAAHQIRALMTVPLLKEGRFVAGLVVHSTTPRAWRADELRLVEETAERTWAAVERARAEAALRASEERYRLLTNSLPEIVYAHDPLGEQSVFNRRWTEFTGEPVREEGAHIRDMIRRVIHPDDRARIRDVWGRALEAGRPVEFEFRVRSAATGRYHWFLCRSAPVRSPLGEVVQWVGTATDIDEQKRVEHDIRTREVELHHRAHHDPLTGLPNRLLFEDRLQLAVAAAARHGRFLAVLFVDLDGFKLINDTLGHEAGDAVLEEVASRLRVALREGDTLARLHGDEFAILLPELAHPLDAGRLARTLLAQVVRPIEFVGRVVKVSASIGVSVFPRDGGDGLALLRAADVAMYKAKLGGKNDVRYFSPAMRSPAAERLALAEHLDGALERQEIELRFQPQWDARTGAIGSFEALLRWSNPVVGSVAPAKLVSVAEERGAFGPIFSWSLDECASCASALSGALGIPVRIALNVSPARVARSSFLPQIEAAMLRHALHPRQLEIEIGVSALGDGADVLGATLETLKAIGVRVTLDHFGADTGMVAPLLDLPLDGVKIDPQLVQRAEGDARLRRSLGAVIGLVHDLDLEVTAVGVETEGQRDVMLELGCERLQGLLLGAPLESSEAERLLRSQQAVTLF
jgi:diguanylate cyclase (GGDEF)-like protein/PAS domain S-box-containing protein